MFFHHNSKTRRPIRIFKDQCLSLKRQIRNFKSGFSEKATTPFLNNHLQQHAPQFVLYQGQCIIDRISCQALIFETGRIPNHQRRDQGQRRKLAISDGIKLIRSDTAKKDERSGIARTYIYVRNKARLVRRAVFLFNSVEFHFEELHPCRSVAREFAAFGPGFGCDGDLVTDRPAGSLKTPFENIAGDRKIVLAVVTI